MGRIIIDTIDVPDDVAARLVCRVIDHGRISKAAEVLHYCWATTFLVDGFKQKIVVYTRRRKKHQTSDSFVVQFATEGTNGNSYCYGGYQW